MSADGKFIPKVPKIQFYLIFWVILYPKSSRNFQKSDLVAWKTLKIKNLLFQSRLTAG